MRTFLLKLVVPALFLAAQAQPALACINDRESLQSEKEFKSSYIEKETPPPQYEPPPSNSDQLLTYGGSGLGLALLVGACVMGLVRTRRVD